MGAINAVGGAFNGLGGTISSFANGIGSAIENGFRSAVNYITSLPNMALQWGRDFIDGLVNGINGAVSNITNAVSNVASTITSFLHFSVPDQGPLTQYESWMPDFMGGLAKGINNNKKLVTDAISGLSSNVSVGVQAGLQQPQLTFAPNSNQVSNTSSAESPMSNASDISDVLKLLQSIVDILKSLNTDIKVDGDILAKIVIKQLNKRRRQVGKTELIL
jgi:phage-related protein